MPRGRAMDRLSIRELEGLIVARRNRLSRLRRDRAQAAAHLARIDRDIASIGGAGGRLAGVRSTNPKSLVQTMKDILGRSGKPMNVGDILKAVESTGYRSTSANFRAIINQTLIKERKHFANAGRGMYALKK